MRISDWSSDVCSSDLLEREHEGAGALLRLELLDDAVAGAAGQAAVVAGDRHAGGLGEVGGEALAPLGEVGEDEDLLTGGEHRPDDLLESRELAGATGEGPTVVLVVGRVVADLLQGGDGREDRALLRTVAALSGVDDEAVEHRLVEADLLGRHGAVVELVDAAGQPGRHPRPRLRRAAPPAAAPP